MVRFVGIGCLKRKFPALVFALLPNTDNYQTDIVLLTNLSNLR